MTDNEAAQGSGPLCLTHSIDSAGNCTRCGQHLSQIAPGYESAPVVERAPDPRAAAAKCSLCDGLGCLTIPNGDWITCPKCDPDEIEKAKARDAEREDRGPDASYGVTEQVREALGMSTPCPITSVLTQMADAAEHLLNDHNCDAHGYEGVRLAARNARNYAIGVAMLIARLVPEDPRPAVLAPGDNIASAILGRAEQRERAERAERERDEAIKDATEAQADVVGWHGIFAAVAEHLGCNARGTTTGNDHVIARARFASECITALWNIAGQSSSIEPDACLDPRGYAKRVIHPQAGAEQPAPRGEGIPSLEPVPLEAQDGTKDNLGKPERREGGEAELERVAIAMANTVIKDDEGTFPPLFDMLAFSGENKAWTVVRGLATAAIAAMGRGGR